MNKIFSLMALCPKMQQTFTFYALKTGKKSGNMLGPVQTNATLLGQQRTTMLKRLNKALP